MAAASSSRTSEILMEEEDAGAGSLQGGMGAATVGSSKILGAAMGAAYLQQRSRAAKEEAKRDVIRTHILFPVKQSTTNGYPHPSSRSREAFVWIKEKILDANRTAFRITFLHVQNRDEDCCFDFDGFERTLATPVDSDRDRVEAYRGKGHQLLDHFVNICKGLGISTKKMIQKGKAKEVICAQVKKLHPDFLVIGRRSVRVGTFGRLFVKSVSAYCRDHAECPVLTINDEFPGNSR